MPCACSIRNAWSVCEQDLITLWMCSETESLLVIVTPRILAVVEWCMLGNGGVWGWWNVYLTGVSFSSLMISDTVADLEELNGST